jgi:hypothetical protein
LISQIVYKPYHQRLLDADRGTGYAGELFMLASRVLNSIKQARLLDSCTHLLPDLLKARAAVDALSQLLQKSQERIDEENRRWLEFQKSGKWAEPKSAS